ncbi:MAG TPA: VOC family protein [Desulfonatronum sp.]|nr:VOC family protein [Desulfonatronum sp.]
MFSFNGIHHIALATRDMDQTTRYWRDLLGARLVAGLGRPGARQYFFEIAPRVMIAFFEWEGVSSIPEKDHGMPVKGPFGFDHVSFGISKKADLWKLKQRLEHAGFWVSEAMDHGFIHSIYTFDPNNIAIEFSVVVPEVDVSSRPKMIDHHPSRTTLEGPLPNTEAWPQSSDYAPPDETVYPGEGAEFLDPKRKNWFADK